MVEKSNARQIFFMKFLSFSQEKPTHYLIEVKAILDVKEEMTFKF